MQIDRPIAIALIIFVIILLAFFLVVPEYNAFKDLQIQLSQKRAEYVAQFDYYVEIKKTYLDLQSRKGDIKKIDAALPEDPALGKTFYFIQDAAQKNGLIVRNLFLSKSSSGAEASSGKVNNLSFSVDLLGDYQSLENFMIFLEKSARLLEVTNISFGSSTSPPYSFSVQIGTYSY